jgi:methylmalonyl-CoA mutase C-terminal domain/subunit
MRGRPIRILMSKPGLDGHDRGVKTLTLALRDEGFEVIYTGLRQTAAAIVKTAIEEDVDVIGMSCLAGNHEFLSIEVLEQLAQKGITDKLVIIGGIIPDEDIPKLKDIGVKAVFGPGSKIAEVVKFIRDNVTS